MTSRDFCYWLQGFFELEGPYQIEHEAVELIQKHLNMVFEHEIDPSFGEDSGKLTEIHSNNHGELWNRPPGVRC